MPHNQTFSGYLQPLNGTKYSKYKIMLGDMAIAGFSNDHINVASESGKVKVSTIIYDSIGKPLATLNGSKWQTEAPTCTFDRNFSKNALEIVNIKYGALSHELVYDVIFQIVVESDSVYLAGKFYDKSGKCNVIYENDSEYVNYNNGRGNLSNIHISPIFKYPSSDYFGKRVYPKKLFPNELLDNIAEIFAELEASPTISANRYGILAIKRRTQSIFSKEIIAKSIIDSVQNAISTDKQDVEYCALGSFGIVSNHSRTDTCIYISAWSAGMSKNELFLQPISIDKAKFKLVGKIEYRPNTHFENKNDRDYLSRINRQVALRKLANIFSL
jgi:hypothetical protein